MLEGAFNAIVDLFKGAADMIEAVMKVIWNLVTGNPGRIKDMLMGWAGKMKLAWEHRGQIADEFLKKWNAEGMWDRGLFQGEVLGWVMMTVLLILVTMGEGAPAAIGGITARWPQLIKLLKTVDTLGDVTTYLGAAAKAVRLPKEAAAFVAGKVGRAGRAVGHTAEGLGEGGGRAGKKVGREVEHHAAHGAEHGSQPTIESSTPAEIFHGYGKLSPRQERLLTALPRDLSRTIVLKNSLSLTDLAALTARTGDEFAVFTRGPQRMVIRGSPSGVALTKVELTALRDAGWKWSGHTHPGVADLVLDASGGDRMVLEIFGQEQSAILNSRGARNVFDRSDNRRVP
jgi:hypothetical protein